MRTSQNDKLSDAEYFHIFATGLRYLYGNTDLVNTTKFSPVVKYL